MALNVLNIYSAVILLWLSTSHWTRWNNCWQLRGAEYLSQWLSFRSCQPVLLPTADRKHTWDRANLCISVVMELWLSHGELGILAGTYWPGLLNGQL